MIPTSRNIAFFSIALLGLAACTGSGGGEDTPGAVGGGTPTEPIASVGFASAATDITDGGINFETQSDSIIFVSQTGSQVTKEDTIRLEFDDDLSRVLVVRNGSEAFFDRVGSTDRYQDSSAAATIFRPELTAGNEDARLAFIGENANFVRGHPNFVVYGFDTSPTTMPTSGFVGFSGDVRATYAPNPQLSAGTANGTFTLTADFSSGEVDGEMSIDALSAGSAGQGSTDWTMNNAAITGNGFSGTLTNSASDRVDPDTIVDTATYDGRFYGVNADAVGGHFVIELTDDGNDAYIYGAFLGDED